MQPPLSQSMSSLKVNNHGNRGTTKHFWLIKSLSKLFPFAELSVLEVAQLLRIPRRLVLSTCTFDGQLPFKTSTWLWGSCTGGERSRRAQPRWRRPGGTKELCEDAQGQLPCTRSQKLLRHACCRPGFSLPPVEWKKTLAKAPRTQASIALTSNFGLLSLLGRSRFGLPGLQSQVCFGRFCLLGLAL